MLPDFGRPSPRGSDVPPSLPLLAVDPTAPLMREFIVRQLKRGTIRVFPVGPGKIFLLPTGNPPKKFPCSLQMES
jgi:hypothetical protein